jgi:hypothetical protein
LFIVETRREQGAGRREQGAGRREWGIGSREWGGWRGLLTGWKAWKSITIGAFRKSGQLRLKPLISAY